MSAGHSKPIRVLLISHSYPPVLGGSEIEAQRVSAALIQRGNSVQVLCAGGAPMPEVRDWVDPEGVPVKILTRHSRGRRKDVAFALRAAWYIWHERDNYDVVYFLMQGLQLALGLPLARLLHKAMVMKIAGSGVIPMLRKSRVGCWELDWLQQWRVPLMLLNEGMIDEALADGFSRENLVWMPNPVDIEVFRPAAGGEASDWRARHNIPLHAKVAVYVGRLSHEKGVEGLLRGFAKLAPTEPDALLLVLGDGALRTELESLANELNVANQIRFMGRVAIHEVPFWLRASDVYALTSPNEGFSCALLEAMSAGLPSVVSAIPANLQLVTEGMHGVTVPWNDADAIGHAFIRLFGSSALRRNMGQAARQRVVDNYSTDKVVDLYENLFSRVMAKQN